MGCYDSSVQASSDGLSASLASETKMVFSDSGTPTSLHHTGLTSTIMPSESQAVDNRLSIITCMTGTLYPRTTTGMSSIAPTVTYKPTKQIPEFHCLKRTGSWW